MLMMGYGVVDVPRTLWHQYNRDKFMRTYEVRIAKLSGELQEAKDSVRA